MPWKLVYQQPVEEESVRIMLRGFISIKVTIEVVYCHFSPPVIVSLDEVLDNIKLTFSEKLLPSQ